MMEQKEDDFDGLDEEELIERICGHVVARTPDIVTRSRVEIIFFLSSELNQEAATKLGT